MKIAVFNNKGGVGKTTTVINLAYALAKRPDVTGGVLVADCDRQENAARFLCDNLTESLTDTRYSGISIMTVADDLTMLQAAAEKYSYTLLDLPPALDDRTAKILAAVDCVIVPVELGSFAVQGIANVTAAISRSNTAFLGALVTRFDRKNSADVEMLELIRQQLGSKVFDTVIPQSRIIRNSISYRTTAAEYMGWLDPAKSFDQLAEEVIRRSTAIR